MNADTPITAANQDRFNYWPLAALLAPSLVRRPGDTALVAGVEAPWGSGKTSFLNLTRTALTKLSPKPLMLDYKPWLYSTVDALIVGFCIQMASQLRKHRGHVGRDASSRFVDLLQAVQSLRTKNPSLEPAEIVRSLDLDECMRNIQTALNDFERPVVVFVDDVDRLPPAEIQLFFQFLKAVADFRGVVYVVAYDPIPVEKALSYENTVVGRDYLKKFIQLPIRLPRVSRLLLRNFLLEELDRVARESDPVLTEKEVTELHTSAVLPIVFKCLTTPRDVVRCVNLFAIRLRDCRQEVELGDLFLYVMLDLISPEAVDLVRSHPQAILGTFSSHPEFFDEADYLSDLLDTDNKEERKQALFERIPEVVREAAKEVITKLFVEGKMRSGSNVRAARTTRV